MNKHNKTTFRYLTEGELEIALKAVKAFFKEELAIFKDEIQKKV